MSLGKMIKKILFFLFFFGSQIFANEKITTTPLLNLEEIKPSFEDVDEKVDLKYDKSDIKKLLKGVDYKGDFLKAEKIIPAPTLGEGSARRLEVHLQHGKKRELRRLFEANRYYVKKLVRVQIGGIILKNIPKGGIKILSKKEIDLLFA